MRTMFLALTLALLSSPAWAEPTMQSGPEEVGTTTMPPGQYLVSDQVSKKTYSLTVTQKGNMILGVAPEGVEVRQTTTASANTAAASTPAATGGTAAAGAAVNATTGNSLTQGVTQDALTGLMKQGMQKGMQRGMQELMKQGGTKQLDKLIK